MMICDETWKVRGFLRKTPAEVKIIIFLYKWIKYKKRTHVCVVDPAHLLTK